MRRVVPFTSTSDSSISFHLRLLTAFFELSVSLLRLKSLCWWKYPPFDPLPASDFTLPSATLTLTPVSLCSKNRTFVNEYSVMSRVTAKLILEQVVKNFLPFIDPKVCYNVTRVLQCFLSWTVESSLDPRIFFKYSFFNIILPTTHVSPELSINTRFSVRHFV